MKDMNIHFVTKRSIYNQATDCVYDIVSDDPTVLWVNMEKMIRDILAKPDSLRQLFRDGYTMFLLGSDLLEAIEEQAESGSSSVVIVTNDDGTPYVTLTNDDLNY